MFDNCIKIDPGFAPSYLGKARTLLMSNPTKLTDVESNLLKALELDPRLNDILLELSNLALVQGEPEAAIGWLAKMDPAMQNYPLVLLNYSHASYLTGDNKHALDLIEQTNQADPTLLNAYLLWGKILQANHQYQESIQPLEVYLQNAPADLEAELFMAKALLETGDEQGALELVERVLSSDKRSIHALLVRGEIHLRQDDFEDANKDFYNALLLDSKSFMANIGMGRALLGQNMPGAGYEYLQKAADYAKTDLESGIALYWQAVALTGFGEKNAAIRNYETLLAYPVSVIPEELRETAMSDYLQLVTPTPSPTPTITPTPSPTRTPGKTSTPTKSTSPSVTPTN